MARKSRYRRRSPFRQSKPVILIATEGKETEPIYFEELKIRFREVVTVVVSPGKDGQSNPARVLARLKQEIGNRASWTARDQAWLVVDTDCWTTEEIREVQREIASDGRLHLASSNPCFELWLLLHFRDTWESASCQNVIDRLCSNQCLGAYSKDEFDCDALMDRIQEAIDRAKKTDSSPPDEWTSSGQTHVYRLVEEITKNR